MTLPCILQARISCHSDSIRNKFADYSDKAAQNLNANSSHELDRLDQRGLTLSLAVNKCYFAIGCAYNEFAGVSSGPEISDQIKLIFYQSVSGLSDIVVDKRAHHGYVLDMLCSTTSIQALDQDRGFRTRLQKRLQRARKFALLVTVFGESVLLFVPDVSVTRVDLIKMGDLQKFAGGSFEQERIKEIKDKIGCI